MENLLTLNVLKIVSVGILTGVFSGVFGVGGGVVLVPILILLFKYAPHEASGTSLVALLLPVGVLGVYEYYREGKIDHDNIRVGLIVAFGLLIGTYFGARLAANVPGNLLQKAFAIFLIFVAAKLWMTTTSS